MTDLPDPADRHRQVLDEFARKRVWLEQIRNHTDRNARPSQAQYDAAKRAAGVDPTDDERTAA